jgi:ketosteroid isomerase-like protein
MIRQVTLITFLLLSGLAAAHESSPKIDVPASASAAAAVVDRFFTALSSGDLALAGAQLDPNVVILESGGAEHSAAEYLGGHAKGDAQFLKGSHHVLNRRTARATGDLVWIASESELHVEKDGKPSTLASTETMVLRSGKDGWKIVHIHWSSRVKKAGESH